MNLLLVSHRLNTERGADLARVAREAGLAIVALPEDREARLPEDVVSRVEVALFSSDVFPDYSRQFFSAVRKAPALKWLHVFNVGVDHPIYTEMLGRGVRLTTSAGSTAEPIAQTAIAALIMLARNFPRWLNAQRERRWDPMRTPEFPPDLRGQTAVIVGLGHIGKEIARLAQLLGLKVVGVRRSPQVPGDPVDEMHTPDKLAEVAAKADWLILACPLTEDTRGLVDAAMLARLPQTARVINVGRGEVVDEPALIDALQAKRLAGAYLDVFQQEPLPPESPLWDLPNVLISPHNSAVASGNPQRVYEIFVDNLGRWRQGQPLVNEVEGQR
jgi:phosphoglycerate dehydrogenase-like enzyme